MWPRVIVIVLSFLHFSLIYGGAEGNECGSRNIRQYTSMDLLDNCTVILGNLVVVLPVIPDYTSEEINNRTFPLLR